MSDDEKPSNVVGIETKQKDELQATVDGFVRQMPAIIEYAVANAKVKKASYDALISEGFTAEQALQLIKQDK